MLIDNKIFYPGKVNYNSFNIDFDKPLSEQINEFNEDLIQVEYNGHYILDIGWYPECDDNGKIIIQLIHNDDWNNPIIKEGVLEKKTLFNSLNKIMAVIESIIATEDDDYCRRPGRMTDFRSD